MSRKRKRKRKKKKTTHKRQRIWIYGPIKLGKKHTYVNFRKSKVPAVQITAFKRVPAKSRKKVVKYTKRLRKPKSPRSKKRKKKRKKKTRKKFRSPEVKNGTGGMAWFKTASRKRTVNEHYINPQKKVFRLK